MICANAPLPVVDQDALVAYQHPLFVYIPPHAELRGGAWVVVDSTINADVMEFYAAEDARGGVLEANGAVAIKFRDRDLRAAAHRLDHELIALDRRLVELKASDASAARAAAIDEVSKQIFHRERSLLGVYQQVAVHFADLHDTPGRMQRKGVIRRQVNWSESRSFFIWRLRRRLVEFDIARTMEKMVEPGVHKNHLFATSAQVASSTTSWSSNIVNRKHFKTAACSTLRSWFLESGGNDEVWDNDDRRVVSWLNEHQPLLKSRLLELRSTALADSLLRNFESLREAAAVHSSIKEASEEDGNAGETEQKFLASVLSKSLKALKPEDRAIFAEALRNATLL
jgi:acetyl-CoA carboxylase/biotin carboxylase 1